MTRVGKGAAARRGGAWWRGTLLVAIVEGKIVLLQRRIVSESARKSPEAFHWALGCRDGLGRRGGLKYTKARAGQCNAAQWLCGGGLGTYKEMAGVIAKGGFLGGLLHGGVHVYQLCLFVELGFKGLQEGVAGHWPAAGARGAVDGGRREAGRRGSVAEGVVGVEFERQAGRGAAVCMYK